MRIVVNGREREVAEGTTVAALVRELGIEDRPLAVERNREIVPRARLADVRLAPADRVEIVEFVGGG